MVALDTDVLVAWAMAGAPNHRRARSYVERLVDQGERIGLLSQVVWEFLHVCTDAKRFERPLSMPEAIALVRELRASRDVLEIPVDAAVIDRVLELVERHRLGRKRILDTVVAACLEGAGITTLATFNAKDFSLFSFVSAVTP